ncbi:MAG: hypothetical protein ABI282_06145, partial [Candidatus Baltobacteraceae bacterium]
MEDRIFMRNVLRMAMVGLILLAGCSGSQSGTTPALTPGMPAGGADQPLVLQTGKVPINWTQFNGPLTGFGPSYAVVVGPDKNMWFSNNQSGLLKVTMTGTMTPVPLVYVCSGTSNCNYNSGYGITVGADNKFYMTGTNYDYNHSKYVVGQATTTGTLKVFDIPSGDYGSNAGLLKGPDGNVWLLEQAHIGKITPGGTVTEFAYPSGATSNSGSLTVGADHNIWFTESSQNIVAKIVPASGKITEFALSTSGLSCSPTGIVSAPDGNLYFNCSYSELGQMTPTGTARQF